MRGTLYKLRMSNHSSCVNCVTNTENELRFFIFYSYTMLTLQSHQLPVIPPPLPSRCSAPPPPHLPLITPSILLCLLISREAIGRHTWCPCDTSATAWWPDWKPPCVCVLVWVCLGSAQHISRLVLRRGLATVAFIVLPWSWGLPINLSDPPPPPPLITSHHALSILAGRIASSHH